jgi:F0F1-type ATP synthase membrane subunit b/b'
MENSLKLTLLVCNNFSLNTDIFESNLINIIILIIILYKTLGIQLQNTIKSYEIKIKNNITDAEERYIKSNERLKEAAQQILITEMTLNKIKEEFKEEKINIIQNGSDKIYYEICKQLYELGSAIVLTKQKSKLALKQETIRLIIKNATKGSRGTFSIEHTVCVDWKICQLEEYVSMIDHPSVLKNKLFNNNLCLLLHNFP